MTRQTAEKAASRRDEEMKENRVDAAFSVNADKGEEDGMRFDEAVVEGFPLQTLESSVLVNDRNLRS